MKTSSFFLYQGPGRVSIALYPPKGTPAGYRVFRQLAPRQDMLRLDLAAYRGRYFTEILGRLDPREVWDQLHQLAAPHEPVLLCWERLDRPGQWCHRRMVAEWFQATLGHEVQEWSPPRLPSSTEICRACPTGSIRLIAIPKGPSIESSLWIINRATLTSKGHATRGA